ncbi:MAG: hypothetical protein IKL68_04285 [Clostridia bacterium]|nr:hypothetical protein [Clostridia bacterium]
MKVILTKRTKLFITNTTIYTCIFLLLINSKTVLNSINISLDLFIHNLIPSLFIYILITEILINSNLMYTLSLGLSNILSKIFRIPKNTTFILIISYLLGYPNAAKCIYKLYSDNKINLKLAKKLLAFTNNASPAYILCSIGIGMFNNVDVGILLLISHFFSSIIIGLCYPTSNDIIQQNITNSNTFTKISSSSQILTTSLLNSFKTLGIILGYTIIFSLIPSLILTKQNIPELINGLFISVFEITNGIKTLSTLAVNTTTLLCVISFILSFSSLMIIFQIHSFVYKIGIKLKELLLYKLIHGTLSSIITYLLLKLNIIKLNLVLDVSLNLSLIKELNIPLNFMYIFIIFLTILLLYITLKKKR